MTRQFLVDYGYPSLMKRHPCQSPERPLRGQPNLLQASQLLA